MKRLYEGKTNTNTLISMMLRNNDKIYNELCKFCSPGSIHIELFTRQADAIMQRIKSQIDSIRCNMSCIEEDTFSIKITQSDSENYIIVELGGFVFNMPTIMYSIIFSDLTTTSIVEMCENILRMEEETLINTLSVSILDSIYYPRLTEYYNNSITITDELLVNLYNFERVFAQKGLIKYNKFKESGARSIDEYNEILYNQHHTGQGLANKVRELREFLGTVDTMVLNYVFNGHAVLRVYDKTLNNIYEVEMPEFLYSILVLAAKNMAIPRKNYTAFYDSASQFDYGLTTIIKLISPDEDVTIDTLIENVNRVCITGPEDAASNEHNDEPNRTKKTIYITYSMRDNGIRNIMLILNDICGIIVDSTRYQLLRAYGSIIANASSVEIEVSKVKKNGITDTIITTTPVGSSEQVTLPTSIARMFFETINREQQKDVIKTILMDHETSMIL